MSNIKDEGTYCSINPLKRVLYSLESNPDTDNNTAVVKKAAGNWLLLCSLKADGTRAG